MTAAICGDFHFCSCTGSTWELNSSRGGGEDTRVKGNQRNQGFDAFVFELRGLQSWAVMGQGLRCAGGMEHGEGSLQSIGTWESQTRPPSAQGLVLEGKRCPSWQTAEDRCSFEGKLEFLP